MQTTRLDRCNDCSLGLYAVTGAMVVVVAVVVVVAIGAITNKGIIAEKISVVPIMCFGSGCSGNGGALGAYR